MAATVYRSTAKLKTELNVNKCLEISNLEG